MNKTIYIPQANVSVDPDTQRIRDMYTSGKELKIDKYGTISEVDDTTNVETETKAKAVSKAILSVTKDNKTSVQDLINEMRGSTNSTETIEEDEDDKVAKSQSNSNVVPKAIVSTRNVRDIIDEINGESTLPNNDENDEEVADDIQVNNKAKIVSKSILSTTQWYEKNPDLLMAEKAAMYDFQGNKAKLGFMRNGKAYWIVHCQPIIAKKDPRNCRAYDIALVYDDDHPQTRSGSSVKAYLLKPTIEDLQQIVNKTPGLYPKNLPHLLRDSNGEIYLCTVDPANTSSSFDSTKGVTSAATSLRFALRWINIFEHGLIDHVGVDSLWSKFQRHGEV